MDRVNGCIKRLDVASHRQQWQKLDKDWKRTRSRKKLETGLLIQNYTAGGKNDELVAFLP